MTPPESVAELSPESEAPEFTLPPRPRGPVAVLRKYAKIFHASLVERMTYRGDFLIGTLLRFLPMLTTILLWQAVYNGAATTHGVAAGGKATVLAGFRYREMIAYLLLTHISRMFSSMPGLAGGIARDIRDGTLKRYLV